MGVFGPSHYDWLEKHFKDFAIRVGVPDAEEYADNGLFVSHGDKAYQYRDRWKKAGIHFYHGVSIFLLAYLHPFSNEVRQTKDGWVDVFDWVITNKERFLPHLDPILPEEDGENDD